MTMTPMPDLTRPPTTALPLIPDEPADVAPAGPEPAQPIFERAHADLVAAWMQVGEQLRSTREHRDLLNDEIRALVAQEELLRRANAVFAKKPKTP
jgi:hypothetical protein